VFLLALTSSKVFAQNVTLQLPTFQVFSVATTVVVPDRGSAFLGGVKRASYGSNTVGVPGLSKIPGAGRLFTNRGIGSEVSSSAAHATATIMDLDELDRAVLAEAAARRGVLSSDGRTATNPAVERKAAFIAKNIAKTDRSKFKSPPPPPQRSQR
jgi:type II secretory pathway component GspD/PulD (secretin)